MDNFEEFILRLSYLLFCARLALDFRLALWHTMYVTPKKVCYKVFLNIRGNFVKRRVRTRLVNFETSQIDEDESDQEYGENAANYGG